jgi:hypothetical protein
MTLSILVDLPIATVSALNAREHHRARARRVAKERLDAGYLLAAWLKPKLPEAFVVQRVHFDRGGKRLLDSDNLPGSCKAIRDEVALCLGVSDGPETDIRWTYSQHRALSPSVTVRVELLPVEQAGPIEGP